MQTFPLHELFKKVSAKFTQSTGKSLETLAVVDYFEALSAEINETLKLATENEIKRTTLYKNLYLPISKEQFKDIALNSHYSDILSQYIGYQSYSDFVKKQIEKENIHIFKPNTTFLSYTCESSRDLSEESKIQCFHLIFREGNKVEIHSARSYYEGTVQRRNNNLYIDVFKQNKEKEDEKEEKTEVILFIGAYNATKAKEKEEEKTLQELVLIGIFSETDLKGNPSASRAVFVYTPHEEKGFPYICKESDKNFSEIPAAIRAYLVMHTDNVIEVTESRNLNMSDLSRYQDIARKMERYEGIYQVYFCDEDTRHLVKVHFQIFPSGRVAYRGRQKQLFGTVEITGGNLYISLASRSLDRRSFFILFVGAVPTDSERVYKGIYSTVGYNNLPHSREGIVVFQPKKGDNIMNSDDYKATEIKDPKNFEKAILTYFQEGKPTEIFLESTQKRFTKEEFQGFHKEKEETSPL